MVEIGDQYELMVWDNTDWRSLGRVQATSDSLIFKAPQGALFWLQNHTKGWEERIFTLDEQGRQVWW